MMRKPAYAKTSVKTSDRLEDVRQFVKDRKHARQLQQPANIHTPVFTNTANIPNTDNNQQPVFTNTINTNWTNRTVGKPAWTDPDEVLLLSFLHLVGGPSTI